MPTAASYLPILMLGQRLKLGRLLVPRGLTRSRPLLGPLNLSALGPRPRLGPVKLPFRRTPLWVRPFLLGPLPFDAARASLSCNRAGAA